MNSANVHYYKDINCNTPPTSATKTTKRSKTNQDSFKSQLVRRNGNTLCNICGGNFPGALEAAHIYDHAYKLEFEQAYVKNKNLPISVNHPDNGLLLCPTCHTYFDKRVRSEGELEGKKVGRKAKDKGSRCIEIERDGTIRLYGHAKMCNYMKLDGTKVPWYELINTKDYPSGDLLQLALGRDITHNKRLRENSESEEEEEEEEREREGEKEALAASKRSTAKKAKSK